MIAIETRPGYVTFLPTGGTVETWEQEYADFARAQEEEEQEQREAEDTLQWHLNYQAKPKETRNER